MSWLGTLAGGVENLLDRVDQVAGQALKDTEEPGEMQPVATRVGAGGGLYQHEWTTTTRPTAVIAASSFSSFSHISRPDPLSLASTHQRAPVCRQLLQLVVNRCLFFLVLIRSCDVVVFWLATAKSLTFQL